MERLIAEQGKGVGFFGLFGDAVLFGGQELDGSKSGFELAHQERIAGAAAGDDELGDFCGREDEPVQGVDHA